MKQKIICPTCGKQDTWQPTNPYRPFCSERCRLIDLGAWANEDYRIPDKTEDNEEKKEDE